MARMRTWKLRHIFAGLLGGVALLSAVGWGLHWYYSFEQSFRRSKPAMEQYAAQVDTNASTALANPPKWLGEFEVFKVEPLPHGFLFQTPYGNPFDWSGIAYSTQPLPDKEGINYFTPIEGDWYQVWRE